MREVWSAPAASARRGVPVREMLFKRDRPKAIDRYIDYFGDTSTQPAPHPCADDVLLETSA